MLSINIEIQKLYDEINSRLYYEGESLKRKDIDFASIQTGDDDYPQLRTFVETALNNISERMLKRVISFTYSFVSDIDITLLPYYRVPTEDAEKVIPLLKKAMIDYIVNYAIYEWLLVVKPDLAPINGQRNEDLLYIVIKFIEMISGRVRRRATDLAGI